MITWIPLFGGIFLGWALGANDSANVFGTAVASRIVSFKRAALLCGIAVILGAVFQGRQGIDTLRSLLPDNTTPMLLLITSGAAALTVTLMTVFRLPVSTSQAIIGAIVGVALAGGKFHFQPLIKIVVCWLATPAGACVIAFVVYFLLSIFLRVIPMSILTRDKILWSGLLIVGIYGAYALGANNVANATGIFSNTIPKITDTHLALIGGVTIALGAATFSKRVMFAVGSGIMPLDAFTALVAVLAMSVTVHIFAFVGVPVSTSQGIVGAIFGIGLIRGVTGIRFRVLRRMILGWFLTPILAFILAAAAHAVAAGFKIV